TDGAAARAARVLAVGVELLRVRVPLALLRDAFPQRLSGDRHRVGVDVLVVAAAQDGAAVVGDVPDRGQMRGHAYLIDDVAHQIAARVVGGDGHAGRDGDVAGDAGDVADRVAEAVAAAGADPVTA